MQPTLQPTLSTARLSLRPATLDDVDALWALWTDPLVRKYLWDDREIAREEAAATLADCCALAPQRLGLWLLHPTSHERRSSRPVEPLVGCAGLLPVSTAAEYDPRLSGLVEPLVALTPPAWGRGFAAEALAELQRYAHSTLALERLAGVTDVPNVASDRMLQRAGFRVLGEVRGPHYPLRTYLWQATAAARAVERDDRGRP